MQTDIVLESRDNKRVLIIDAKFYGQNMQAKAPHMSQTLRSVNLYQIFAYVKNWPAAPGESVAGMLLYAGTDDEVQPDYAYQMGGNKLSVRTLDLNCEFAEIAAKLDAIAERIAL